jgi:hypothetical protein
MSIEAYTVSYDKANYRAPIPLGFEPQAVLNKREESIKENILRYLAEYRIGVKFDEFFYREEKDNLTGQAHLSAIEPGRISDIFRRAIKSREEKGLEAGRETAECLGFQKLEQELLNTSIPNKLFVWISPPGPREDGYGLYSFTFVGQVINSYEGKRIRVIPYRNIMTLDQHRKTLLLFSDHALSFKKDTDFLSNPITFSPNEQLKSPEDIINFIGEQEEFNIDWMERLRGRVGFLIDAYIDLVRNGASENELLRSRNALENYTIKIRDEIITGNNNNMLLNQNTLVARRIFDDLGDKMPPPAAGSCGSASTLIQLHEESNKNWEYHTGDCVVCHARSVDVGPCSICKECEKSFDE